MSDAPMEPNTSKFECQPSLRGTSYDPERIRPLVGTRWVWGTDVIVVSGVFWNGEEWWVETRFAKHENWPDSLAPDRHWNDVDNFWGHAHRIAGKPGPGTNPKGATRQGQPQADEIRSDDD